MASLIITHTITEIIAVACLLSEHQSISESASRRYWRGVTCVQQEAEYQDLYGCTVQKALGTLRKAKKRQRCNSSRGEILGADGCTGTAWALVNGQ